MGRLSNSVGIFVDGVAVEAAEGGNLLEVCLKAGRDVPYFCWHPAMGSVGACRQCAVTLFAGDGDEKGKIVMACVTRVEAGMRVGVVTEEAVAARAGVVEFLMVNHPHDCPVCEVGGDCHLQDMVAMTGHHARRARVVKRVHKNQDLGPYVKHEMNRCIGCYRCVRFYKDYAGGDDFGVFGAGKNVFFGRAEDGVLESPFAGNLVEVCPTGVFVDKPFSARFRRKWDMRATGSVCPHCAVGCNITIQERGGVFRRVVNRFNETLNGWFLCDRGRFGVGFLESAARVRVSRDRYGKAMGREAVVGHLAGLLGRGNVLGVGSARASVESNFLLRRVVGVGRFFAGVSRHEAAVMAAAVGVMGAVRVATVGQVEAADAVLVLGVDPVVVAPRVGLAVRQVGRRVDAGVLAERGIAAWDAGAAAVAGGGEARGAVFVVSDGATGLDGVAREVVRVAGEDLGIFGAEVAGLLERDGVGRDVVGRVVEGLRGGLRPVVVVGGGAGVVVAAGRIVRALGGEARVMVLVEGANAVGLACLGAESVEDCGVMGADIVVMETGFLADEMVAGAAGVTVLDCVETEASRHADMVVAVGSFADCEGMFVSLEGRAQGFERAVFGAERLEASWEILRDAGIAAGVLPEGIWRDRAALLHDMGEEFPVLRDCLKALPRDSGATLPFRYSGRTAERADVDVREALPVGGTMEGVGAMAWAPGWNSGQAVLKMGAGEREDVFLFGGTGDLPEVKAGYGGFERGRGEDELSALSPAVIARRG